MADKGKSDKANTNANVNGRTRASKRKTEAWPEKAPQETKKQKKNLDFFSKIDASVEHILSSDETLDVKDYMDLYSSVYDNLVEGSIRFKERSPPPNNPSNVKGCTVEDIYNRLGILLRKKMKQISQEGKTLKNAALLNFYADSFTRFKKHAAFLDGIFGYMNRVWVRHINNRRNGPKTIYIFAMTQWRDTIFKDLTKNLTSAFFAFIQENRRDLNSLQELIKKIVDSFISMSDLKDDFLTSTSVQTSGSSSSSTTTASTAESSAGDGEKLDIYVEKFETPFLEISRDFYRGLSEEWMSQCNVENYMKNVEKYLEDETTWASSVLDQSTVPKISVAVLDEFVRNRVPFLLESFDRLVTTEDFASLKCMYGLLIRLSESSMNSTVPNFRREMINRGLQAVVTVQQELKDKKIEAKQYPSRYVSALAAVCRKHDNIIRECFNNHSEFRKAYDEACVEFINRNAETKADSDQYNLNKTPEQLSRYANNFLNANSTIPTDEVPDAINNVFLVLKFTESKDSFEKYYNLYLLDRLIKKTSSSDDLEASVISQMKSSFGGDYSLKSHQLTQDARVSQDLSKEFKTFALENNKVLPWDFQINIFRNGSCKLPISPPFNIPSEIAGRMQDFSEFYSQHKFPSRVLSWYHNKSHGELIYNAGSQMNKKYTLVLSTFQMTVLLMYNNGTSYSYDEIKENTQISDYILNQILPVFEKTKILTKNASTGDYELFECYKSNKSRMDINIPLRMEVKTDTESVDEDVQNQRKYVLQAIMVRLMKANQKMRHTELISQTITEASKRFKPNVSTIKRTIEGLIEREYFKRDDKENDLYVYVC